MRHFASSLLLIPCFTAFPLFAQLPRIPFGGGFTGSAEGIKGDATFNLTLPIQVTVNAPFSGAEEGKTVQTLADGTHVTHEFNGRSQKAWRDSQGRVRIEEALGGRSGHPVLIEIEDPVAGYIYVMDDMTKVAHRVKASSVPARVQDPMEMQMRPAPAIAGGGGGVGGVGVTGYPAEISNAMRTAIRPQMSPPEDLGTQTIDGITLHGSRTTTVIPTGSQGNDGPITVTRDAWYSPDLNLVIRTVTTDPRSGVQTNGIGNLSRNEPDPGLFKPPADYAIVDEASRFTIHWGQN